MNPHDYPVLDLERMALITGSDAALAHEFLDALATETAELLAPLRASATELDEETVISAAHTLKGIAREVGAARLAFLAARFESDPSAVHRSDHLDAIDAALRDLARPLTPTRLSARPPNSGSS